MWTDASCMCGRWQHKSHCLSMSRASSIRTKQMQTKAGCEQGPTWLLLLMVQNPSVATDVWRWLVRTFMFWQPTDGIPPSVANLQISWKTLINQDFKMESRSFETALCNCLTPTPPPSMCWKCSQTLQQQCIVKWVHYKLKCEHSKTIKHSWMTHRWCTQPNQLSMLGILF